ncbi:hypothetical protein DPMN_114565 [Dreissena polymorpha]|uniref:Uncharacterized protein n=1 Tax=Dreissena polymorpha TaxID=45954 RepID=A0A9D4QS50_DREPO|nr:hypothetical protein DPMN_114565 [Dreissena polymorpha]
MVAAVSCVMATRQPVRTQTDCITSPGSYWPLRRSRTSGQCSTPSSYWTAFIGVILNQ